MSYRRSLSFAKNEKELLEYYDNNGKSDIAKEAMKFYRDNKDKVITDATINLIKSLGFSKIESKTNDYQNTKPQDKLIKLKK